MENSGFKRFSNFQLAGTVWVALILATVVFLALDWSILQMGILLVPLLIVAIAVSVAAIQNNRGKPDDASR